MTLLICPYDGSPLHLDTEHAHLVAQEREPTEYPHMWRCLASGHTIMDRPPAPYRPDMKRSTVAGLAANRANGRKGGEVIRRLKAAGKFYWARSCYECGTVFMPTSGNQRCKSCR